MKKGQRRKWLALFLAFAMALTFMPGTAWAEGNDAAGTQTEPQPGAPEVSEEITALQERIDALPDADMLESMTPDERDAAYAEVLAVYDAIDALEEGADQLDTARLDAAAEWFNSQTAPAVDENTVATIGEDEYTTLADAIAAAREGETVVLQQDVEVGASINVATSITLNLNGKTITNLVEGERLFSVTASGFTVDGTTADSAMTIPESNTGSYGFIKVAAKSTVTLNGGTYSGNTDDGAFVKVFHNDELDASGSTVVFNNAEMISNNRFFSTDTLTTDAETPTLQVTGGTYTTTGQAFGMDVLYSSPVTFTDATVTAGTGPCIEVCGPAATFTNCNFTVTGENSNGFGTTAVAVSWSGTAEINGGTYSATNGYGVYVYNSGGKITIKDGTVSGGDAAVRADANVQASSPQQSTVIVEGGSTEGAWETNDAENAPLVVMGGTHTVDVTKYLAEGCTLTENEGTYTVQEDQAVQVGDQYYGTLERAFANAGQGDTVKLLADIELTETQDVTVADITLDLNGKTISGSVSSTGLIRVGNGASLTVTDLSSAETKGTITNTASSLPYCLRIEEGSTLTLERGVNITDAGDSPSGAAVYVYPNTSGTNLPVLTVKNANLTSAKGFPIKGRSSFYVATVNIEGGYFAAESKNATTSLCNSFAAGSVTLSGGTFANWSSSTDNARLADGSILVLDESGNVTVASQTPAQYLAHAAKDDLKAYLTDGDLYNLIQVLGVTDQDIEIEVASDVALTYPEDKYFGSANESASIATMTLNIASDAKVSGTIHLRAADVAVMGGGSLTAQVLPYSDQFEVTNAGNTWKGRIAGDAIVATVSYDGNTYAYTDFTSAWSNVSGSSTGTEYTITLYQDVRATSNRGLSTANLTLDLNGHSYTFTGTGNGITVYSGRSLNVTDSSETGGGRLVATNANVNSMLYTQTNSSGAAITVGESVTVEGPILLLGDNPTLDVYGTIDTTALNSGAIYNNGSDASNSTINLYEGSKVNGYFIGVYHPGTGTLNVYGGAEVKGTSVGIEMRSGTLNVYDGAQISGGNGTPSSAANGSGTTTNNAGIAVAQHTTGNPVAVNVYGGTISGGSALYESNPQGNGADSTALIELNIRDGMFRNTNEGSKSVYSETQTGFISGGRFTDQPDDGYIYTGLDAVPVGDNTGDYIINRLQNVYLDGVNGSDSNSGNDSSHAVETLEHAMNLVADDGVIYICGTVTVDDELLVDGVTIERADGFTGQLISVDGANARLSLSNTTINGKKAAGTERTGYLVFVTSGGTLDIGDGTTLTDNNTTAVYVNNNSYMNMTGGAIQNNTITNPTPDGIYYGGAGISNGGTTDISGGVISGNLVTDYGGGGISNERGTVTLRGDAVVRDNTAAWGGGVATIGAKTVLSENASITENQSQRNGAGVYLEGFSNFDNVPGVFEMTGGSITGNQVTDAGWGAGIYGYDIDGNTIIRISGGAIEDNQSDYEGKAIAISGEGSYYARLELSGAPVISGDVYYQGEDADGYVIHVTDEFNPTEPITLNREIEKVGITAVEYAAGLTPDTAHFTGSRAGDILEVNSAANSLDWAFAAPQVRVEASGTTLHGGGNATLTAIASHAAGGVTYTYQWCKDGTAITGQTGDTLTVSESGRYTVKVTAHKGADIASAETESVAVVVTAEGHVYVPTVTKPTCTERGYTTYTCSCGESYVTDYTEATGHSFSDKWFSDGKNHWHECTVCGAKKDVSAHTFEWVKVKNSSDADASHEICNVCGYDKTAAELSAKTGDNPYLFLWILLFGAAGIALTGAIAYRRKRQ